MKLLKTKRFIIVWSSLLLFTVAIILNFNSLENAKEACIGIDKTPKIERGFFTVNWSVSCK
ncbi:MAG: hypothetical protein ACQEUT_19800 [Bacillota bacterium]